jgi:hypothetical protein
MDLNSSLKIENNSEDKKKSLSEYMQDYDKVINETMIEISKDKIDTENKESEDIDDTKQIS